MNFDEVDNIVRTALQAMRQGRTGFLVQQVNCVNDHHEVLYYECLARLLKLNGSVTAGEFLPALGASGYAPELDRCILTLAFEWLSNSACGSLGCNISSLNFSSGDDRAMLYDLLHRNRSLAPRLVLEITESAPSFGTAELIQDIRKLGYRVAIDDFGTGFWTPEAIFSMAVDIIKIDAFFVQSNSRLSADRVLYHMAGLASCVAPTIVVEGIETYEQLTLARAAGATHVQGYLLSEPPLCPVFRGLAHPAVMGSTTAGVCEAPGFTRLSA